MRVAGIDPGVSNFGIVVCDIADPDPRLRVSQRIAVLRAGNVSLRSSCGCMHDRVPLAHCSLGHTNDLPSRIAHVAQDFELDKCDRVVVERQPPQSAGYVVEQILRMLLGNLTFVEPRQIHKTYGALRGDSYDERKRKCEAYTSAFFAGRSEFDLAVRRHDMADAMAAVVCYAHRSAMRPPTAAPLPRVSFDKSADFEAFIGQFRSDI